MDYFVHTLTETPVTAMPRIPVYRYFDLDQVIDLLPDSWKVVWQERIDLGNHLYVAKENNAPVGWRWLSEDHQVFPADPAVGSMPTGHAYAYGAFVRRVHRGRGIMGMIAYEMFRRGGALCSYTPSDNLATIAVKESYGENVI